VATAVKQGKAIYAGISRYSPEDTRVACEILAQTGTPCVLHQVRYSLVDRAAEQGLLATLQELGVGCIAFSPLAQGLLTDRYLSGVPADSRIAKPHGFLQQEALDAVTMSRVHQLHEMARQRDQTLAQFALAWVLRQPQVTSVLIGASSRIQLDQDLSCVEKTSFTNDELTRIDDILSSVDAAA
jgi:L-glyceraldehyde 3-phosphate reductase